MLAAKIYYRQGNFASAVEEYERLRFAYPKDAVILENLGLSQLEGKLTGRAAESFHQLEAAGGMPARRARFYLGRIAFDEGRFQEALDLMQKSLPSDGEPDFGERVDHGRQGFRRTRLPAAASIDRRSANPFVGSGTSYEGRGCRWSD